MNASFALPRGIRNNNPGNIRLSKNKWQGQKEEQLDGSFVEFISPLMGLRALMMLLLTYHLKYGLDDIESIMNRYAPPHENDTGSYVRHVMKIMGLKRNDKLDIRIPAKLINLTRAIVLQENGPPPPLFPRDWFEADIYRRAADLALFKK